MDASIVLAIILAHPSWPDRNVSRDVRAEALQPVAEAIADAAANRTEAAQLIADGMHESGNFSLSVVRRGCEGMAPRACDHRTSRGFAQLKAGAGSGLGRLETIRAEARCAVALMRQHLRDCRAFGVTPVHGMFAALALGHCGAWRGANDRVVTARKIEREIWKAERDREQTCTIGGE